MRRNAAAQDPSPPYKRNTIEITVAISISSKQGSPSTSTTLSACFCPRMHV